MYLISVFGTCLAGRLFRRKFFEILPPIAQKSIYSDGNPSSSGSFKSSHSTFSACLDPPWKWLLLLTVNPGQRAPAAWHALSKLRAESFHGLRYLSLAVLWQWSSPHSRGQIWQPFHHSLPLLGREKPVRWKKERKKKRKRAPRSKTWHPAVQQKVSTEADSLGTLKCKIVMTGFQ